MTGNKNKTLWYVAGLHFKCTRCGRCCSGPGEGYIWVTKPQIKLIADFLKISVEHLRQNCLKRIGLRTTIIEQPDSKDCIFLRKIQNQKKCVIYPVRPTQCRAWPFWPSNLTSQNAWNNAAQKCPGINQGKHYTSQEIEKIKKNKKWWQNSK